VFHCKWCGEEKSIRTRVGNGIRHLEKCHKRPVQQ
jgi:hypothetical protein